MIHFNVPAFVGTEIDYMREAAVVNHKISGDGPFTKKCSEWMEARFGAQKILLTTSGTSALEMAAMLCDIKPGDEVIMPSFTFTSTATAFVQQGAKIVFVDIRPDTMNIDENLIEDAITDATRVIVVVDYAGVAPDMDAINVMAKRHGLLVVEDAAQGVMSKYKGHALGTIADFGCYSFHETKNYSAGEGGAIVINDAKYNERAEIIREKGTNRAQFFRGEVAKYNWMDKGSSYLPSELCAAYLWAQLEMADEINGNRLATWETYREAFEPYSENGIVELPTVPEECTHNGHMFYLKLKDLDTRTRFIAHMREHGILCVFHYVPLHSSPGGITFGRFAGADRHTTTESERLVRLPMYYNIDVDDLHNVISCAKAFLDVEGMR